MGKIKMRMEEDDSRRKWGRSDVTSELILMERKVQGQINLFSFKSGDVFLSATVIKSLSRQLFPDTVYFSGDDMSECGLMRMGEFAG